MKVLPADALTLQSVSLLGYCKKSEKGRLRLVARTVELEEVVCLGRISLPQSLDILEEGLLV